MTLSTKLTVPLYAIILIVLPSLLVYSKEEGINFGIVIIPDTQYYSGWYAETFEEQTHWACSCSRDANVIFASHLGDLVHNGSTDIHQWKVASSALFRLDSCGLPYGILPGNHDVKWVNGTRDYSLFSETFPRERYLHKKWFGGAFPVDNATGVRNNFELIEYEGEEFIFIHMEYLLHLEQEIVTSIERWINALLSQYSTRTAFLTTHYAGNSCNNNIHIMTRRLMYNHCNLLFTFGGHIRGCGGENTISLINKCEQTRFVLVSNYQIRERGGNGWLRYYRFRNFSHSQHPSSPSSGPSLKGTICAFTYSPQLGQFEEDEDSYFSFHFAEKKDGDMVVSKEGCELMQSEKCSSDYIPEGFLLGTFWIAAVFLISIFFVLRVPLTKKEWLYVNGVFGITPNPTPKPQTAKLEFD